MSETVKVGELKFRTARCSGCAFSPGTEANLSEITQLKVNLCLESRVPFYCHEPDGGYFPFDRICAGYTHALLERGGDVPDDWRRKVYGAGLRLIAECERDGEPAHIGEAWRAVMRAEGLIDGA
jgi:hypothetical protein